MGDACTLGLWALALGLQDYLSRNGLAPKGEIWNIPRSGVLELTPTHPPTLAASDGDYRIKFMPPESELVELKRTTHDDFILGKYNNLAAVVQQLLVYTEEFGWAPFRPFANKGIYPTFTVGDKDLFDDMVVLRAMRNSDTYINRALIGRVLSKFREKFPRSPMCESWCSKIEREMAELRME